MSVSSYWVLCRVTREISVLRGNVGALFPFMHTGHQTVKEPLTSRSLALGQGSTSVSLCNLRNLCSQLGLFVEFSPEEMLLGTEETEDDGDLEAELLALTGEVGTTGRKPAPKGQGEFTALGGPQCWDHIGSGRWGRGFSVPSLPPRNPQRHPTTTTTNPRFP